MTVPNLPTKQLKASVTIELPLRDADPQEWDTYDVNEMAKRYTTALVDNLLEELEGPFEDETLTIIPTVQVVNPTTTPQGS